MLIAIRHAETDANDAGKKTARGWLPIPLTLEGMKQSEGVADLLVKHADAVKAIWCDSLVRVVQTAQDIAQALDIELSIDDDLRTLNIGDLTGNPVNKKHDEALAYYMKHPNQKIPGGESYNQFLKRVESKVKGFVEGADGVVLVTHGRIISLLAALSKTKGKKPDLATLCSPVPVDPAGIMVIGSDWTTHYQSPRKDNTKDLS